MIGYLSVKDRGIRTSIKLKRDYPAVNFDGYAALGEFLSSDTQLKETHCALPCKLDDAS
jgi:hypothetical protein